MALKSFVTATNAIFTVADNASEVIGGANSQTVRLQNSNNLASGVLLDANIENIELRGAYSDYKFVVITDTAAAGFQIQNATNTYGSIGSVVATIPNINSLSIKLKFTNGYAALAQVSSNVFTLNAVSVDSGVAGTPATTPTLTPTALVNTGAPDCSTVTYTNGTANTPADTNLVSKSFVTSSSTFTVADHDVAVKGYTAGTEVVRIQAGVTGVTLDANIERVELSAALATYKFVSVNDPSVSGLQIQNTDGSIVATLPNINQNVEIAFTDGSTTLAQSTSSTAFTLGGAAVHVGATGTATTPAATLDRTANEHSELGLVVTNDTGTATNIGLVFDSYDATSGTSGTVATVVATGMADNAKVEMLATKVAKIATNGITGAISLTGEQFTTLTNKLDATATLTVYADSGTAQTATVLAAMNTKATPEVNANIVTTVGGLAADIKTVTDAMGTGVGKISMTGLTTLNPSDKVLAATFDSTVFTQALPVTINLANVADNAITSANGTVPAGKVLKIDGHLLAGANILTFDGHAEQDGSFSVTGGAGSDVITGGAGTDTIAGGAGSDTITGGAGSDAITDASGDDVYVFNTSDVVTGETLVDSAGTDTIKVVTSTDFANLSTATIRTAAGIEQVLIAAGGTATFTGAQLTDQIIAVNATDVPVTHLAINVANTAINNFTNLTFAAVSVGGGAQNAFDTGVDTVTITVASGGTADVTGTSLADTINAGSAGTVTINGGAGSDTITGGGESDVINGGTDNDSITGGGGSDTITGGAGSDAMSGGAGDDVYVFAGTADIGAGDSITEAATSGTDTLSVTLDTNFTTVTALGLTNDVEQILIASNSTATFAGAQLDGLTMEVNATGASAANLVIAVASGTTDTFANLTFANAITVGGGAQDAFTSGLDTVTITVAAGTADVTGTSLADTITASAAGTVTINGGAGSDTITGGGESDVINGGTDNDSITGGGGSDTITGGAGSDAMSGGAGDDVYVFTGTADIGAGDSITEAATSGTDTLSVTLDTNFTTVSALGLTNDVEQILIASGSTATFAGAQLDGLTMEVNATGSSAANLAIAVASGATDTFANLTFANAITVGGGAQDVFTSGLDTVTITVAAGTADVTGTSLADMITATGAGTVTINGGAGSDTITGGDAGDTFEIDPGATGQIIIINDFNGTNDTLSFFPNAILNVVPDSSDTDGIQRIEATNAATSATTIVELKGLTNAQDKNLFNMNSFNTLFAKTGRAGDDIINGTAGIDTMTGGDGRDAFVVASTLKTGAALSDSTTTAYDKITDFGKVTTAITSQDLGDLTKFGAATDTSVGGGIATDILDINLKQADDSTANTLIVNADVSATDVKSVVSGSTTITGVISGGLLTITGTDAAMADTLAEWVAVAQVTGLADTAGDSVAFEFGGNTYVFAENGAVDVLVELTNVTGVTGLVLATASTSAAIGDIFII
jgi:Ca2+-binding RTX toxin-like protein